jgi:signal transduction histidine kinase
MDAPPPRDGASTDLPGGTVPSMSGPASDPGPATAPGRQRSLLRTFLLSPLDPACWRASFSILLGLGVAIVAFSVLAAFFSTGGSLLIWIVGIPIIAAGIEWTRLVARVERWRVAFVDGSPLVPHGYASLGWPPRSPYGAWLRAWFGAQFVDGSRWLDVVYVLVLLPLAILEFSVVLVLWVTAFACIGVSIALVAVRAGGEHLFLAGTQVDRAWVVFGVGAFLGVVGILLVPTAASVSRGLMLLHRAVVQGLLCVDPSAALRQDVERLRESRSAALDLEASELRRIERDLHDGAQQRLVMLAIDLGLAEERIDEDPAGAKSLIVDAREQARLALADIRDLVRGTAPSILLDRGLVAALGAVAGGCPVPTILDSGLPTGERLPPAVERAAYFVVAESLANAAKHSGATRCDIVLRRAAARLLVEVRDDGHGGATPSPGGGLAGLRDRVEALDGVLTLTSPAGGPTVVRVELPLGPDVAGPAGDPTATTWG